MGEMQAYEEKLDSHRHGTPRHFLVELMAKNSSGLLYLSINSSRFLGRILIYDKIKREVIARLKKICAVHLRGRLKELVEFKVEISER